MPDRNNYKWKARLPGWVEKGIKYLYGGSDKFERCTFI